jgi:hypothetical protein
MLRRAKPGRGGRRAVALALLTLVAAGATAAPADAYVFLGQRWPGTTIRYHSVSPSLAWPLQQAARAWNTSGTRLRFVKTSRARAQVVITAFGPSGGLCWGNATAGYVPAAAGGGRVRVARACDRFAAAAVLAHELGHVLSLGHENRRCATMNSVMWARCEFSPPAGQWRCRLIERDDRRGAVRRYGGAVKPVGPIYCWMYPPPPAPTEVTATSGPASGADVLLRWKNTSSGGLERVEIARGKDVCPATVDESEASWTRSATRGKVQTLEDFGWMSLATGRYCYALWSYDDAGRTAGPRTVWVDHVDSFPPPSGLVATPSPAPGVFARLQWTNPANPRADFMLITRKLGSCPTDPSDDDSVWLDYVAAGPPGTVRTWDEPAGELPGAWCYAVWSVNDDLGRQSSLPATDVLG